MLRSRSRRSLNSPERSAAAAADVLEVKLVQGIDQLAADRWDACIGADQPFLSHAFLAALEASGSACQETGWLPLHVGGRAGRPPARLRADVSQEPLLWRVRVRLGLGQRVRARRRALLSEAAGGGAVHPGAGAAPAAGTRCRAGGAHGARPWPGRGRRAARRVVAARHLLPGIRMGVPRGRGTAQAPGGAVPLAQSRLSGASRTSSPRSRAASARPSARSAPGSPSRA